MGVNSLTERNEERNVQTREETRSSEKYIKPAVNIIETNEGLTLTADIPGAAKESLDHEKAKAEYINGICFVSRTGIACQ